MYIIDKRWAHNFIKGVFNTFYYIKLILLLLSIAQFILPFPNCECKNIYI